MKTVAQTTPSANLAINKSRIKVYNKKSEIPTYYLQKGQEFQIELFNPTTDTILAKISLNNNTIAQGGLVLRPGERVFLERYIDVEKKFKFDTYEVSNTSEVKKAIKENGDFKVEFYREEVPYYNHNCNPITVHGGSWGSGTNNPITYFNTHTGNAPDVYGNITTSNSDTTTGLCNASNTLTGAAGITLDGMGFNLSRSMTSSLSDIIEPQLKSAPLKEKKRKRKTIHSKGGGQSKKTIETGRVEAGSHSSQKLKTVSKNFEWTPFHTVEYKMLPLSQKINTVQDVNVKRYCTECGTQRKPNFKFCPNCGSRV